MKKTVLILGGIVMLSLFGLLSGKNPPEPKDHLLSMVSTSLESPPSLETLQKALKTAGITEVISNGGKGEEGAFGIDSLDIMIAFLPVSIPDLEAAEGSSYMTSVAWQMTGALVKNRKSHLIIVSRNTRKMNLEYVGRYTRIVAALAAGLPDGVFYWGESGAVLAGEVAMGFAPLENSEDLPVALWVDMTKVHVGEDVFTATLGLPSFGYFNLQAKENHQCFEDSPHFLMDLAVYALENQIQLKAGETVGNDDTTRYPLKLRRSVLDEKEWALQVE